MAGHSHWAGIKHKKAINDAKKGKVFTKIAMLIYSAVKEGGGPDPEMNPRLRLVLEKARAANMPKDNVKRAIEKASGAGGEAYEQKIYEGYAPGGVALMIDTLTDNSNRTFPEVRKIMDTRGGSLGQPGCVSYLFSRRGVIIVKEDAADEEALMDLAIDAGAEDVTHDGEVYEIQTAPEDLLDVKAALDKAEIPVESAEITMLPGTTVPVSGEEARKVMTLIDELDDHDDVQNVYANFDIPEEELAALEAAE
jgi:YebC/PmpR family DNA-binding regulatory protein